jgi:hypothetical protein
VVVAAAAAAAAEVVVRAAAACAAAAVARAAAVIAAVAVALGALPPCRAHPLGLRQSIARRPGAVQARDRAMGICQRQVVGLAPAPATALVAASPEIALGARDVPVPVVGQAPVIVRVAAHWPAVAGVRRNVTCKTS